MRLYREVATRHALGMHASMLHVLTAGMRFSLGLVLAVLSSRRHVHDLCVP